MTLTIGRAGKYVFDDPHTVNEYAGNLPSAQSAEKSN
jgi:hypothetical protein